MIGASDKARAAINFSGNSILIIPESTTRKSQTLWLWVRSLPAPRICTRETDREADFEVPKKGTRVVEAMIISSR